MSSSGLHMETREPVSSHLYMDHTEKMGRRGRRSRRGGGGEEKGLPSESLVIVFQIRPNSLAGCQTHPRPCQVTSPPQSPAVLPTTI